MTPRPSSDPSNSLAKTQRGLACPRCGCRHLPVVYTRPREDSILRCRECRHCGKRITTRERS